ncbi:alpha/beta fold hydrolase [Ideonella livida]|uniref:Alpha/beta hydrolase n=1 Tax=Ideonella livida TaxID=2707176 RepID=A0A7C9TIW8_9BURK|nr:alpha/beta hydrolase [Ideonella livida]NDY90543.1 alpha/beta hydrolase [Ideonella livida]
MSALHAESPRFHHVVCADRSDQPRMAWTEWGDPTNPRVLVCVHGLSRQGRDFDTLAQDLAGAYRVVCPDVVGRGRSDWLRDPMGYAIPAYAADMMRLVAALGVAEVDWVGTSMGGLIGLALSSLPGSPVRRLVLNDVGPRLELDALQRIGQYLGAPVRWDTLEQAAEALWAVSASFGPHTPAQWMALTRPQLVADGTGFKPHYDPAIALPFKAATAELVQAGEAALWQIWDHLRLPALVLRGQESDLLTEVTLQEMLRRQPLARAVEFAGVGHAPMLQQPDQREAVRAFLEQA